MPEERREEEEEEEKEGERELRTIHNGGSRASPAGGGGGGGGGTRGPKAPAVKARAHHSSRTRVGRHWCRGSRQSLHQSLAETVGGREDVDSVVLK